MIEFLATALVVLGAAAYLVFRALRKPRKGAGAPGCGGGCQCPAAKIVRPAAPTGEANSAR